jgi:PKD domain
MLVFKTLLVVLYLSIVFPSSVFAHGAGLPPVVSVNGQLVNQNAVGQVNYLSGIWVPEDKAPSTYVLNSPITFELDLETLGVLTPDAQNSAISWDFGDGSALEGVKVTKTYTKIGSFAVNVYIGAKGVPNDQKSMIQSVLLHSVPSPDYVLPEAVISLNGKKIVQSSIGIPFDIDLRDEITLDASKSLKGTTNISSYFWDLDQGISTPITSSSVSTNIAYTQPKYYAAPLLRVTDENGFISDSVIVLRHVENTEKNTQFLFLGISGIIVLIVVGVLIVRWKLPKFVRKPKK